MIECSEQNIWYKKRKKSFGKKVISLFLIALIVFTFFIYYKHVICGRVYEYCKNYVNSYSSESINLAIIKTLQNKIDYSELVNIEKNTQGDITLISANSLKINGISQQLIKTTKDNLTLKLSGGIPIPAFAFTGISIISGYGNKINFTTMHVESVWCEFDSKFSSVGINQTLHSIYANINCDVSIDMPLNEKTQKFSSSVLICETILVGKVPQMYWN